MDIYLWKIFTGDLCMREFVDNDTLVINFVIF